MRDGVSRSVGRASWCLLLLAAMAGAGSCRSLGLDRWFGGYVEMRVSVATALNEVAPHVASPVAVELLVVYDKQVLATLQAMTAQQWFEKRQQLLQQYQTTGKLDAWKWEWTPGQVVPQQVRSYDVGVRGGILFANYFSPGDHRATIDPFNPFLLSLGPTSFTVERLN